MIEVIDNVFDEKTVDDLYGHFRDFSSWGFTGSVADKNRWRKFQIVLDKEDDIHSKLFLKADGIFTGKLPGYKQSHVLRDAYASGYLFGTYHEIHKDYSNNENGLTVMFYLNKVWQVSYGGETVFLDPTESEIITSVIPKPGRALLFNGCVPHCAREVSRTCVELRMVATFKIVKKDG